MPILNYKAREIIVKIVYYGPGLGGKTTSLQCLHQQVIPERRGEMYFLATETDQTIYFELLPLHVGEIKNFKLRFQMYTVPGQVKYNQTRKVVLQGVDALVFVADSQRSRRKANLVSLENLKDNLRGYNLRLEDLPLVYQYNKRDLEDLLAVEDLNRDLNPNGLPYFETVATEGKGVLDAFEIISTLAIKNLEKQLQEKEMGSSFAAFRGLEKRLSQPLKLAPEFREKPRPKTYEPIDLSDVPVTDMTKKPEPLTPPEEKEKHISYVDIVAEIYHNGEIIFEEGDVGNKMYFVESGKVKIIVSSQLTKKVLTVHEKGDFFGEMALFGETVRSAKAVAIGTTHLLPITRETLASQIQIRPEIAVALLKTLSNQIRNNIKTIGKLADQNKELRQQLKKAHTTMKQLMDQNEALRQKLASA